MTRLKTFLGNQCFAALLGLSACIPLRAAAQLQPSMCISGGIALSGFKATDHAQAYRPGLSIPLAMAVEQPISNQISIVAELAYAPFIVALTGPHELKLEASGTVVTTDCPTQTAINYASISAQLRYQRAVSANLSVYAQAGPAAWILTGAEKTAQGYGSVMSAATNDVIGGRFFGEQYSVAERYRPILPALTLTAGLRWTCNAEYAQLGLGMTSPASGFEKPGKGPQHRGHQAVLRVGLGIFIRQVTRFREGA